MGAPITSEADCLDACCEDSGCTVYQYASAEGPSTRGSGCWLWERKGEPQCEKAQGWNGGRGRKYTPPPPPPPPGAPKLISLPTRGPLATKLPFTLNVSHATSPSGEVIGADSVSLLRGENAASMKRWYAIGKYLEIPQYISMY